MRGISSLMLVVFLALISVAMGGWSVINVTIPSTPGRILVTVPMNGTTIFTVVHCFGEYNWYIGADGLIPNETVHNQAYSWTDIGGETQQRGFGWDDNVPANHVFVCINQYPDTCGTLQLIVSDTTAPNVTTIFPDTTNKGLTGKLAKDRDSGSVSWTKTVPAVPITSVPDTYEVWYATSAAPKGYYDSTSCSVRGWMTPFNASQGSVVDNGDGTITANVKSLDPKVPYTLVVLSNRDGGYSNAYNAFTLNGSYAYALAPSMAVFMLLAAIVSLF